jgi:MOSC domain-containing protein
VGQVSRLSIAPVKGLALLHPDEIRLEPHGVTENRRFHLIEPDGRRFGAKECAPLVRVRAEYDATAERLALRFPDGAVVEDTVRVDGRERVVTDFYGRPVPGRVVEGPWSDALTGYVGRRVLLVRPDEAGAGVDRGPGPVTLVSDASVDELARQVGDGPVDARRFRMLVEIAGLGPHEEDEWVGRVVRVGGATVRVLDAVGRCVVTTRNPDTGVRDLDTLGALLAYRGRSHSTGGVDFGVWGDVVEPGRVRVGDDVEPV